MAINSLLNPKNKQALLDAVKRGDKDAARRIFAGRTTAPDAAPAAERPKGTATQNPKPAQPQPVQRPAQVPTPAPAPGQLNAQDSALFNAIGNDEPKEAAGLLSSGANVNARDTFGRTPLIIAATMDSIGLARVVIAYGADMNAEDDGGYTALQYVIGQNCMEMARLLVENGADVNYSNPNSRAPLLHACELGRTESDIDHLVNHGAHIFAKDKDGKTALMITLERKDDALFFHLIDIGADIDEVDNNHKTILMIASETGNMKAVRSLIEKGVDIDKRDINGMTALRYAMIHHGVNGDGEVEDLLRQKGAPL